MNLEQLSKTELLSIIYNETNIEVDGDVSCGNCGYAGADYYYICDHCNEDLSE